MSVTETLQNSGYTPTLYRAVEQDCSPIDDLETTEDHQDATLRHPLCVKPEGNALTSAKSLLPAMGVFGRLPDALILLFFEYLDEVSLSRVGMTCRGLFAYSVYDQLWRDIVTSSDLSDLEWKGSWRASRKRLKQGALPNVDCSYLFSDALYRPFQCAQLSLGPFVSGIPAQNRIARLPDLSPTQFGDSWTDQPFILTDPVRKWRVFGEWTVDNLLSKYGSTTFRAESVDWPLHTYVQYMNDNSDESPLYLFDRAFAEKMKLKIGPDGDYEPPACFGEDLFMLLGHHRPDHRWLIIGPERSGSTFHKDPNATSAWNAVIRGSKYWIMFPNKVIPPGVYMSEDQSEVTSPLSIAEWLFTFHEEARNTPGCIEGICCEGEVLHVPSGWWHLVVNLEPSIALTQNFVPMSHLRAALHFLKNKADQVSGFKDDVKDPHALFLQKIEQNNPEIFVSLQSQSERKRKWEDVVGDNKDGDSEQNRGQFTFGFGDDIAEDDDEAP